MTAKNFRQNPTPQKSFDFENNNLWTFTGYLIKKLKFLVIFK